MQKAAAGLEPAPFALESVALPAELNRRRTVGSRPCASLGLAAFQGLGSVKSVMQKRAPCFHFRKVCNPCEMKRRRQESNPQPLPYKGIALPVELNRHEDVGNCEDSHRAESNLYLPPKRSIRRASVPTKRQWFLPKQGLLTLRRVDAEAPASGLHDAHLAPAARHSPFDWFMCAYTLIWLCPQ